MPLKIKKAVIPAAGLGTRFLPATKVVPKELLPIVDKPAVQYIVEEALAAGIEEIIFVISPDKRQIVDHFRPAPDLEEILKKKGAADYLESITAFSNRATFRVVIQEKPLGLGHAVHCAKEAVGSEWFLVFLPDDLIDHETPCAVQMLKSWETHKGAMIAVMEVPWDEVHLYGVVKAQPMGTRLGKVESLVEKPRREGAPSNLAIIGRYLLPPETFSLLEKVTPGAIGEIQLTDALTALVTKPGLFAFQFEGDRFDVGNKFGFLEANINFALKHEHLSQRTTDLIKLMAESR